MQDTLGVWRRACGDSLARNRRDPTWLPTSGEGGAYKPSVKGHRAGRESEGLVVPTKAGTKTPSEGRGLALVMSANEGKREGMVRETGPNHPVGRKSSAKVRKLQGRLFVSAKFRMGRRSHAHDTIPRGDGLGGGMGKVCVPEGAQAT